MQWAMKALSVGLAFATTAVASSSFKTYSDVTVFDPPSDYTVPRTLYARTMQLADGSLLSTWENYLPNNDSNPYFPIYKSTNNGESWSPLSRVYDEHNHWGARYQPFLYLLPQDIGSFKKGDVLLAGNFIPNDLSKTQIDLYVSKDSGSSWSYVSTVASGGEALPDNGLTPVWEPFLMVYQNQLICYYSDQRDPSQHGQMLVHQTTTDLVNWGPVVQDVAYPTVSQRPGMATVSALPGGKYIMTYEFGGAPQVSFAVFFRIADSPLEFGAAPGWVLRSTDNTIPVGSPYNVWSSCGGENGTIIVSSGNAPEVFINTQLGALYTPWYKVSVPATTSYSRSLRILSNPDELLIVGGGVLNGESNKVQATLVQVPTVPGAKREVEFQA